MNREFPDNLDQIFHRDQHYLDNVYAILAIHCLLLLGQRQRSYLTPRMRERQSFMQGYLQRLAGPTRDSKSQGLDDGELIRCAWRTDVDAARKTIELTWYPEEEYYYDLP